MQKLISLIVASVLIFLPNTASADVWGEGGYAGIGLGDASATLTDNTIKPTTSSTANSTIASVRLLGGYSFNRHFAIEGELVGLGSYDVFNSAPPYQQFGTINISGASIAAVGRIPIKRGFSLFGKLGLARTTLQVTPQPGIVYTGPASISTTSGAIGFGGQYDFNSWLGVRISVDGYSVGDTTGYSGVAVTGGAVALFRFE